MPKVSVVVPVYNVEKYIERCARSLFEQTLDDIEYVFIDDCSQDKSIEILKSIVEEYKLRFVKENKVVRIEFMPTNSGLPAVRRHGIQLCTGDYIIHCDSDDWVNIEMYENMYRKAVDEKSDVVICDYIVTDGLSYNKHINACHAKTSMRFLENCLFQRDPWSLWNKLFKRKAYYNVEYPTYSMGEDLAMTTQLLLNSSKLSYIPNAYYYYFQNSASIIHQSSEEAILKRYEQLRKNTNIVIRHIERGNICGKAFGQAKPLLQMNACVPLLALFDNPKYREMWRKSCPHLSIGYLLKMPFPLYAKYIYLKYSIKYRLEK